MTNAVKKFEYIEELDTYFEEVKKYKKRLTRQQERDLAIRIQAGDESAVDILVKHNLRFVISIAKKYRSLTDVSFADLISEGNLGLIKAARKFDPNRNIKFSSYAVWWIRAGINECIDSYKDKIEYNAVDDRQIINLTDVLKKELSLEQQENLYHLFEIENERNAEELKEVFIFAFTLAIKLLVV